MLSLAARSNPADPSGSVPVVLETDSAGNATRAYGTTVPTDTTAGYAVGCQFRKTNGGAGTTYYVNEGLATSSAFVAGGTLGSIARATLVADTGTFPIPVTEFRSSTALQTPTGSASTSVLGLVDNTFGTGAPTLETTDLKTAGLTSPKARFLFAVPKEYVAAGNFTVTINAGMKTTVADTTATVDCECVRQAAPTVDICATAAQSINSLTAADKTFTLTGTSIVPGDILDVRLTVAVTDASGGTAVIGKINSVTLTASIKG